LGEISQFGQIPKNNHSNRTKNQAILCLIFSNLVYFSKHDAGLLSERFPNCILEAVKSWTVSKTTTKNFGARNNLTSTHICHGLEKVVPQVVLRLPGLEFYESVSAVIYTWTKPKTGVDAMMKIFFDFLRKKLAFFLKKHCYDPNFAKSSCIWNKKRRFFSPNFLAKIFLNHNIGPWVK
jgi:hypothetical protein